MRNILAAFAVAVLLSSALFAESGWYIGIEAGYSYSIVDTATGWDNTYNENGHGFDISIPVEYRVNDNFSVNTGLRWIMKSSEYTKLDPVGSVVDDLTKMHHFIEIPLTVRFYAGNDLIKGFLGAGGYIGVRVMDIDAGTIFSNSYEPDLSNVEEHVYQLIPFTPDDNLFDAGVIGEAGLTFTFTDLGYLYTVFRVQYGLTSLEKKHLSSVDEYFTNLSADVGFMFAL